MCCLSASPIRRACRTAGHSTPCSQYQPCRRSRKTRCAFAAPSTVSSTRKSRSTDVPAPHFCWALSSFTRNRASGCFAGASFAFARPWLLGFGRLPPRAPVLRAAFLLPVVLLPDLLTLDTPAPIVCYRCHSISGFVRYNCTLWCYVCQSESPSQIPTTRAFQS